MKQEDTKHRILDKALELFSTQNYDSVSVGEIAKAVGIKVPSLYNHMLSAISGNPENIVMIRRFIEVILGREIKEIHRHRRLGLFRHSALACF